MKKLDAKIATILSLLLLVIQKLLLAEPISRAGRHHAPESTA
jgi:hypothetical protein